MILLDGVVNACESLSEEKLSRASRNNLRTPLREEEAFCWEAQKINSLFNIIFTLVLAGW